MSSTMELSSVLQRLSIALDDEVKALSGRQFGDLTKIMNCKARCLLEISRILKGAQIEGWISLKDEVQRVLNLLHANERALSIHLEAATALGTIIREVLVDQSSDGTYVDARRAWR